MSIILPEKEKDDKAKKKIKEENEKEEVEEKDGQKVGKRARERIKEKMEENERCFRSVWRKSTKKEYEPGNLWQISEMQNVQWLIRTWALKSERMGPGPAL